MFPVRRCCCSVALYCSPSWCNTLSSSVLNFVEKWGFHSVTNVLGQAPTWYCSNPISDFECEFCYDNITLGDVPSYIVGAIALWCFTVLQVGAAPCAKEIWIMFKNRVYIVQGYRKVWKCGGTSCNMESKIGRCKAWGKAPPLPLPPCFWHPCILVYTVTDL